MEMSLLQPFSWEDHSWKLLLIALVCRRTGSKSFVERVLEHDSYAGGGGALGFACQNGNEELANAIVEQWHRYYPTPVPGMVSIVERIFDGRATEHNKQVLEILLRAQESVMLWQAFEWHAARIPQSFCDVVAKYVVLQPPRYLALAIVLDLDMLDVLKMDHVCKATNNYSLSIPVHHGIHNLTMDMTLFDYLLASELGSLIKIRLSQCHNFLSERQARSVIDDIDVFDNDFKEDFRERFLLRAILDGNSSRLEQALDACKRAPCYQREDWMALLKIPRMDKLLKSRQGANKAIQDLVETTPKRVDSLPRFSSGRSDLYIPKDFEIWLPK